MRTQFTCDEVAQLAKYVTTDGMVQPITPMDIEDFCIRECERKWPGSKPNLLIGTSGHLCVYAIWATEPSPKSPDGYDYLVNSPDRLTALVNLVIQIGEKK